nr:hypothetical protein [uncultured Pedobacter sp.]
MRCECIENAEKGAVNMLRKQHPERVYDDVSTFGDTGFQNLSLSLGEEGGLKLFFEFKTHYTFTKANGEQSAQKTHKISLYPSYCPFCGRDLKTKVVQERPTAPDPKPYKYEQ